MPYRTKAPYRPSNAERFGTLPFPAAQEGSGVGIIQKDAIGIYERFSTASQGEKSELRQDSRNRTLAEKFGCPIYKVYVDRAKSGVTLHRRAAIHQLLTDAADGHFNKVIVESIDRLARDMASHRFVFRRLVIFNVQLFEANGSRIDEITLMFKGLLSVEERRVMLDRTYAGRKRAVVAGIVPHKVRFGYSIEGSRKGRRVIHPQRSLIVEYIFSEFADGASRADIAVLLTGSYPTPQDCRNIDAGLVDPNTRSTWTCDMITDILSCFTYKGALLDCTTKIQRDPVTHLVRGYCARPPEDWARALIPELIIVTSDVFDRCYLRLQRLREDGNKVESASKYLFTGRVICALCGNPMITYAQRGVRRYKCSQEALRLCIGVGRPTVRDLEDNVIQILEEYLVGQCPDDTYALSYTARSDQYQSESEDDRMNALAEIERITGEIEWIQQNAARLRLKQQRIDEVVSQLQIRKDALDRTIKLIIQTSPISYKVPTLIEGFHSMRACLPFRASTWNKDGNVMSAKDFCNKPRNGESEKRRLFRLIRSVVRSVKISADDNHQKHIEVELSIQSDQSGLLSSNVIARKFTD